MRLFLDTEFNGFGSNELISLALVAEDGREFYEVVGVPKHPHAWVAANVVPVLGKHAIGIDGVRRKLHGFLAAMPDPITVVADWPEDVSHFAQLLLAKEPGMAVQKNVQMLLVRPRIPPEPEVPHNALSDARALGEALGVLVRADT